VVKEERTANEVILKAPQRKEMKNYSKICIIPQG